MKKLALVFIAIASLLSGCVVYDQPYGHRGGGHGHGYYDRDRDGVPNAYDRRPNNPRRY